MTHKPPSAQHRPARQQGVSLVFALLALVSLSLASVALVRSVDTSALVMGNLGFKQDATAAADRATQQAITLLSTATLNRNADSTTGGYYAIAHESIDATGQQTANPSRELINWDVDGCDYATNAALATCLVRPSEVIEFNGNRMRYVIFRLCSSSGAPDSAGNACARPALKAVGSGSGTATGSSVAHTRGELKYGQEARFTTPAGTPGGAYQGVYYRIVVRVIGARNTTSFVETIVHL